MSRALQILERMNINLVLVDVGASKEAPPFWKPLAGHAVYVGFDPDDRDFSDQGRDFAGVRIISKAIVAPQDVPEVDFYLTDSPYCSSTLMPDLNALDNYLLRELFQVTGTARVPATSLDTAIKEQGLDRMDWVKADTQGIDLRIFSGLPDDAMKRILAVDIEPGLIDAYKGEDKFTTCHEWFLKHGFWPAELTIGRTARIRRSSLAFLESRLEGMAPEAVDRRLPGSPAWVNVRYLRTAESMAGRKLDDWAALWVIAMMTNQPGFALDLALEMVEAFDGHEAAVFARDESRRRIKEYLNDR